jgi:hypothetical protein
MRGIKHTPGPWTSYDMLDEWFVGAAAHDTGPLFSYCGRYDCGEADARLAAAAPDLLEALIVLVALTKDFLSDPTSEQDHLLTGIDGANIAIAKATGTAP